MTNDPTDFIMPHGMHPSPAWLFGVYRPALFAQLAKLSDEQMRDIGITRAEFDAAAECRTPTQAIRQLTQCRERHLHDMS